MTTAITAPIQKPAETNHPINPLIRDRWSPRAFADRPVEHQTVQSLFEAARWAASGGNQQPGRFIVSSRENREDHARLAATLAEQNLVWAQHAPVLILAVAR